MVFTDCTRRQWLRWVGGSAATLLPLGCSRTTPTPEESPADSPLRFQGKVAMRVINDRPPCLETPWDYFRHDLTPNEAFYVRWHLQVIPTTIDTRTYRLRIGGAVQRNLELSLDDFKKLPTTSVVAVNQCSGNSRSLFTPQLPGAQWGNGALGNARWTGVRLRDILDRAGLLKDPGEVAFQGLDRGGAPGIPDFVKTLPPQKCQDNNVLVAYAMNDEPLPLLNGFPLRLVVPGWYATYWVKALEQITVFPRQAKPFSGFWMTPAYRIPPTPNGNELPGKLADKTIPIHRMNIRSFFCPPRGSIPRNTPTTLEGFAFDGGDGIRSVEVSDDGGTSWQSATLGDDLGNFSFRRWRLAWTPTLSGQVKCLVRATSRSGEVQPAEEGWNRSGYMRNVIEQVTLEVS